MSTDIARTVEFELEFSGTAKRPRYRVSVLVDRQLVHADTLDLFKYVDLNKFLNAVEIKCREHNVTLDRAATQALLLNDAHATRTDKSPPPVDEAPMDPEGVLADLGIEVLGELANQTIVCWINGTSKRWLVEDPGKWSEERMMQAGGETVRERLWLDPRSATPDGQYKPATVRQALALAAAKKPQLAESQMLGQGVWRVGRSLVFVNGAKAWKYRDGLIRRLRHPIYQGRIIDFDQSKRWGNGIAGRLRELEADSNAVERSNRAFWALVNEVRKWNWTHQRDAHVVAALVFCTFVQTVWTWRPLVSIIGPSDCGKSTLLNELLHALFGQWAIVADRSTEAGLRQAIGHDAMPVLIDEFDVYRQRQQVLELFRTSSRGGRILRGTQDQRGLRFGLRHLAWFFSIESGDVWTQDRNRFIRLELRRPENRGELVLPNRDDLKEFGQQIAALAIWATPRARELADTIRGTRISGVAGRLVESFAVPAAMAAVLSYGHDASDAQAGQILAAMIQGREALEVQGEADEIRLLRDIFSATVKVPIRTGNASSNSTVYEDRTVAQILGDARHEKLLEAHGIRRVHTREADPGEILFIVEDVIREKLLAGTRWKETRIDQILARLSRAKRVQQRCAEQRRWGMAIPWATCLEIIGDGNTLEGPNRDNVNLLL